MLLRDSGQQGDAGPPVGQSVAAPRSVQPASTRRTGKPFRSFLIGLLDGRFDLWPAFAHLDL